MLKKEIINKTTQIIITILGITFLSFLLIHISPGDPVRSMFVTTGNIPSDAILEQMREELGLNRPFLIQYFDWLLNLIQGNLGVSYSEGAPVTELLIKRVVPTINLALLSLLIMLVISIPLGIISAVYSNKFIDFLIRMCTFVSISIPNFWVGLLLLYIFGVHLNWIPVVSKSMGFEKIILPAITLSITMAGKYTRQVRIAVLEELDKDYVVGAKAKGISKFTILTRHVLPNAMLPLITMLGLSFGSLLGGTAVVEIIFSYHGLGSLAISAIASMDYPLIQGFVLWIALIYMLVNMFVDISYKFLDPRTTTK